MVKLTQESTYIAGELGDIATEFAMGLSAFYRQIKSVAGEETANEILVKIGECAVASEEELKERLKNING